MTTIQEILNVDELAKHIARGDITERFHPDFPELVIYNYSDKVAFSGNWTHETMTCRGLIVNLDTQEVLARPLKKFFNLGQAGAPVLKSTTELRSVGNKEDGSLGIAYMRPDGKFAIATRGSFVSDQAIHATENLTAWDWANITAAHRSGWTSLFEIVYPDNRIVLDYGGLDALIPIGAIIIESGAFAPANSYEYTNQTLADILALPDRPNKEGWVIWLDAHTALKIKQSDYVELHRIVTGLNRKSIWRRVSVDSPEEIALFLEKLPDELVEWAEGVVFDLRDEYAAIMFEVDEYYVNMLDFAYESGLKARADLANYVMSSVPRQLQGFVFATLDGKDIQTKIWNMIEPVGSGK